MILQVRFLYKKNVFFLVFFFISLFNIYINDELILVYPNTSVLEACENIGIQIPRFCYHERLNVAGNCRMCLIEIEKAPKPTAACAVPVEPNMVIFTNTPLVEKARENVLEFLLLNHPLDCPICDQGGECDLQEQVIVFGSDKTRFFFPKRSVEDKNCGLLVKTIMTRCIHCTRCVRFFQDILGQSTFGTTLRGRATEIGSYVEKTFLSEFSGNIIDLCPVGALTSKPYAFSARSWELRSVETIDLSDSVGSNIRINFKETQIVRILPLLNDSLNEEWISDKTRFSFDGLRNNRLFYPYVKVDNTFLRTDWKKIFEFKEIVFNDLIRFQAEQIIFISGNNVDFKTLVLLRLFSLHFAIKLLNENFVDVCSNLMLFCKSNVVFSAISDSDLCVTFGTNLRFEAALLNLRLRKQIKRGNFTKASFGLCENDSSSIHSLGNSTTSLSSFMQGQTFFCKKFTKARNPFLIVGTSFLKRLDSGCILIIFKLLSNVSFLVSRKWIGFNFLPFTPNSTSELLLSIKMSNKHQINQKKIIYFLGLDFLQGLFAKLHLENSFIISQHPFVEENSPDTLLLPSSIYIEKAESYVNLEGRFQRTTQAMFAPAFAKDDAKILSLFFVPLFSFEGFLALDSLKHALEISDNCLTYTKSLIFQINFNLKKRFNLVEKATLVNFFSSNIFTNNSPMMTKSANHFVKFTHTFLLS